MAKLAIETIEVSALIKRPKHLEAMGLLTVEITHMERAISDLFSTVMGIHFFLAETIYFTANSAIARMDIVGNAAPMVLSGLPADLKKVQKLIGRAKATMGKRHAVIHSFWMLSDQGEHLTREKLGEFKNRRIKVVALAELEDEIERTQRLTNDINQFCVDFRNAHPREITRLREYWN